MDDKQRMDITDPEDKDNEIYLLGNIRGQCYGSLASHCCSCTSNAKFTHKTVHNKVDGTWEILCHLVATTDIDVDEEIEWDYQCPWDYEKDYGNPRRDYMYDIPCKKGNKCKFKAYLDNLKLPASQRDNTIPVPRIFAHL